jgi:hypothetical protein
LPGWRGAKASGQHVESWWGEETKELMAALSAADMQTRSNECAVNDEIIADYAMEAVDEALCPRGCGRAVSCCDSGVVVYE